VVRAADGLRDVTNDMTIAREEIFGPVAAVIGYDTVDDAVAMANDNDYGLSGSVFTADIDAGIELAERIQSGTFGITRSATTSVLLRWRQGVRVGREMGPEGLDDTSSSSRYCGRELIAAFGYVKGAQTMGHSMGGRTDHWRRPGQAVRMHWRWRAKAPISRRDIADDISTVPILAPSPISKTSSRSGRWSSGDQLRGRHCVTRPRSFLVAGVVAEYGRIYILAPTTGSSVTSGRRDHDEIWANTLDTNLTGIFKVTGPCYRICARRATAGSLYGLVDRSQRRANAPRTRRPSGVSFGFVKSCAQDVAGTGITVNAGSKSAASVLDLRATADSPGCRSSPYRRSASALTVMRCRRHLRATLHEPDDPTWLA